MASELVDTLAKRIARRRRRRKDWEHSDVRHECRQIAKRDLAAIEPLIRQQVLEEVRAGLEQRLDDDHGQHGEAPTWRASAFRDALVDLDALATQHGGRGAVTGGDCMTGSPSAPPADTEGSADQLQVQREGQEAREGGFPPKASEGSAEGLESKGGGRG